MKKIRSISALILALLMVFSLAACSAQSGETAESAPPAAVEAAVYENEGFKLTVPAEYAELVIVDTDAEDMLFSVSEKASVEASDYDGAGWLFGIGTVDEARLHELMTGDMMTFADPFAKDADGSYYLFYHPSDVRIERAGEITDEDMQQWSALCEWAQSVKESFIEENGLEAFTVTNTELDIELDRVAYLDDVAYTISTTEHGPMEPGDVDKTPFVEQLLGGMTSEYADGVEAPDGEYVVLTVKDGDTDVRIDFFSADDHLVRVVRDDMETLYTVQYADGSTVARDVMQSWYDALVAANA